MQTLPALFRMGVLSATPGALAALERNEQDPQTYLGKHQQGDWGMVCDEDAHANAYALLHKLRLFSVYVLPDHTTIWIITEADRSYTTMLLPEEY